MLDAKARKIDVGGVPTEPGADPTATAFRSASIR
jgi:hypothetical protein